MNIAKGGVLSAGNAGVGTLTLGGLNLAEGAVLNYDLGQANTVGGALNDRVQVNGNLQLDGTLNVAQSKGGVFGAGIYRLIDYTGSLTDNGLDIGSAPIAAKDLQVQTSVAKQVNLVNRTGLSLNFWGWWRQHQVQRRQDRGRCGHVARGRPRRRLDRCGRQDQCGLGAGSVRGVQRLSLIHI